MAEIIDSLDFYVNDGGTSSFSYKIGTDADDNKLVYYAPTDTAENSWCFTLKLHTTQNISNVFAATSYIEGNAIDLTKCTVTLSGYYLYFTFKINSVFIEDSVCGSRNIENLPINVELNMAGTLNSAGSYSVKAEGTIFLNMKDHALIIKKETGFNVSAIMNNQNVPTVQQPTYFGLSDDKPFSGDGYETFPTECVYNFIKSYDYAVEFSIKLPGDLTHNNLVGKYIYMYSPNVDEEYLAVITSQDTTTNTVNAKIELSEINEDKVIRLCSVPYLISLDRTNVFNSPTVLQFNRDSSSNNILLTVYDEIKVTEFIEHDEDSILFQKGNRLYAKEFIEGSNLQFNKDYSIIMQELVEV